ncbi:MAG: HAMP domain-containing histidine kinase [Ignavibacteriales bacterium]|nr:HAMP domain-containing histidine kinase [Ignavibacteriales bacterium]
MKLLNKINRNYALLSSLIFLVGIIFIFIFMEYFISSEIDEKLETQKLNVIKNLDQGLKVEFTPFVEVKEIVNQNFNVEEGIKDTSIYNKFENEFDSYRQLKTIYSNGNKSYLIIVRTDNIEKSDLLFTIGIPFSIILLLTIFISNLIVRKINISIWKPFYMNLEKLKNFSVENKDKLSLINTDIDEFNDLNNSLIELTGKISRDYKKLKEFSENASHELQTPIAIIKAKIEAMLQDESLSSEAAAQLQTINSTATRLARINKSLTILSKLDSEEYEEKKVIALKNFIQKKVKDFIEIAESKGIAFEIKPLENFELRINEDLLELLMSNLISNAIKHNYEGGKIVIEVKDGYFLIKNTGMPLNEEPEKMFERFAKGSNATDSSGLGLVIVKQICDLYKYKIEYSVQDEWHQIKLFF